MIIGEWSGALNPGSLRGEPEELKNWISAQLELYERCCAGWFFWTYKKEHTGDKGWCFRDAVEGGVFPAWVGLRATKQIEGDEVRRDNTRDASKDKALGMGSLFKSILVLLIYAR